MTLPLMFLAFASIFAGYLPFSELVTSDGAAFEAHLEMPIAAASVGIGLLGILIAMFMYMKPKGASEKMATTFKHLYKWSYNKFYIDEVYLFVTKKIIFDKISKPVAWFDKRVVDATMNGFAWITNYASFHTRELQSGQLQKYAFVFISGVVVLVLSFVYFFMN